MAIARREKQEQKRRDDAQGPSEAGSKEALPLARAAMAEAHDKGNCKPCLYFTLKADSCRNGDKCEFCHRCTREVIKAHQTQAKNARRSTMAIARREKQERKMRQSEGKHGSSIVVTGFSTTMMQPMPTLHQQQATPALVGNVIQVSQARRMSQVPL